MKYIYFVSLTDLSNPIRSFVQCEVELPEQVSCLDDILSIQEYLKNKFPEYDEIVILGVSPLRTEQ